MGITIKSVMLSKTCSFLTFPFAATNQPKGLPNKDLKRKSKQINITKIFVILGTSLSQIFKIKSIFSISGTDMRKINKNENFKALLTNICIWFISPTA